MNLLNQILFATFSLLFLTIFVHSRQYTKCELARELKAQGIENLEDWVCLAMAGTAGTLRSDFDQFSGYGLFQIPQNYCGFSKNIKGKCKMSCFNLLDGDIRDDVRCVMKIINKKGGFSNFRQWDHRCKRRDRSEYLKDCWNVDGILPSTLMDYMPALPRIGIGFGKK